jgi:hypothetical protein
MVKKQREAKLSKAKVRGFRINNRKDAIRSTNATLNRGGDEADKTIVDLLNRKIPQDKEVELRSIESSKVEVDLYEEIGTSRFNNFYSSFTPLGWQ